MSDLRISYDDMSTCAADLDQAATGLGRPTLDGSCLGSSVVSGALDDAVSALDWLLDSLTTEVGTLRDSAQDAVETLQAQDARLAKADR